MVIYGCFKFELLPGKINYSKSIIKKTFRMDASLNNEILVIENQYIPCFFYFKTLSRYKHVKFEQYDWYKKMGFRNRCLLAGPNGILSLSVPLQNGRDQKAITRDIKICYKENWARWHWRSIHDAYRKAPFFEYYMDDIKSFFDQPTVFLFDWNMRWIEWVCRQLAVETHIGFTDKYLPNYPEEVKDFRNSITPKNYMDLGKNLPAYPQVFEDRNGFRPNLCVLDAIFCTGPSARYLLTE
jgi:WbqC-like protein family